MTQKKTFTFALVHMTVAFGVVWALTGSMALGGLVALIEPACQTVAYFCHEKVWERFTRKQGPQTYPVEASDGAHTQP